MTDGCGPSFSEFARYSDPDGCWVKTSQGCSQRLIQWDDEADCLEPFSETWPRSATVWNTTAYQLPVLARPTGETGSGSSGAWPTPRHSDYKGATNPSKTTRQRVQDGQANLAEAVQESLVMFPTPTANPPGWKHTEVVDKDGKPPTHPNQRFYNKATGQLVQRGLEQVVQMFPTPVASDATRGADQRNRENAGGPNLLSAVQMFPTPTSRDWKDTPGMAMESVNPDGSRRDRTELLPGRIYSQIPEEDRKSSGQLNPTWVEWLMGYPLGWTDLEV